MLAPPSRTDFKMDNAAPSGEPMTKNEKKAAAAKPGMSRAADSHREVIVRIDLTNKTLRREYICIYKLV